MSESTLDCDEEIFALQFSSPCQVVGALRDMVRVESGERGVGDDETLELLTDKSAALLARNV